MTPQIILKLHAEIRKEVKDEAQVVYLMVGIRKIFEQENLPTDEYFYLRFHCDWALHAKLDRASAKKVLTYFDSAHIQLSKNQNLTSNDDVEKISKMDKLREELSKFLQTYSIQDFTTNHDAWAKFLYLYARVVEDVPLLVRDTSSKTISQVVVSVETAKEPTTNLELFKVSWNITDKNGKSGSIFVINSLALSSPASKP